MRKCLCAFTHEHMVFAFCFDKTVSYPQVKGAFYKWTPLEVLKIPLSGASVGAVLVLSSILSVCSLRCAFSLLKFFKLVDKFLKASGVLL